MHKFPRFLTAAAVGLATSSLAADRPISHYGAAPALPKVADGWKVELIATQPVLHWPSVVECAPDGRIFIGEDPMDMPGPGSKPIDRILCIHPDGHVTVFADHLYAVFGLRYVDGKLFVHQSPKFTVFTDDNGVGKDPKDIWDTDCIATWGGGNLNDHIPANIRLAMDGYLYMSIGDKGVFNCKSNIDGRTAELHGGGVLRIRPDGTGMEVYATGTRNHLDVALNAEDEIFTYDNTDDGLGWWTRYTHMVDGGYYGYPHDYRPEESAVKDMEWYRQTKGTLPYRPWTLWRIDETGGGSAVGCVGYNEDALPEKYRGNSFNCEWGKGKLQRFHTVRDGATYKIAEMEDVMLASNNFRPLGISVTPDGTGFYIADWQYGGWNVRTETGRLLKLAYTGEMHPAAKPQWFVPAAEAKPFQATLAELIAGLSHPAESVRLVAQRRVAEHGKNAIASLVALMSDAKAPAYARWQAIWTLDMIDGGQEARLAIVNLASDDSADVSVRMQAVRQLGTRRAAVARDACAKLLGHADAAMRFRAATALGRIGNSRAVPALLDALKEPDFFAHFAVFTALKRIGQQDPRAWPLLAQALASDDAKIRAGIPLAIHEVYDKALAEALAEFSNTSSVKPEARVAALRALAEMHRKRPAWDGRWWGTQPQRSPLPAKTVEWDGTPIVLTTIESCLKDADSSIRAAALDSLQTAPDPAAVSTLVVMFGHETDAAVRKGILHALAATKSPDGLAIVVPILKDAAKNAELVPDAVSVAEAIGSSEAIDALIALASSDNAPEVLSSAFEAMGRMRAHKAIGPAALPVAESRLENGPPLSRTAIAELQRIFSKSDPVKNWQIIGPFAESAPDSLHAAAIKDLDHLPADLKGPDGKPLEWKKSSTSREGYVDLSSQFEPHEHVYAYAAAELNSPVERDLALTMGSDDGLILYLNGVEIFRDLNNHAWQADQFHADVHLLKGRNIFVARITQDTGPWGFSVAYTAEHKGKLFEIDTKSTDVKTYDAYAIGHEGEANKGSALFHNAQALGCIKCHAVAGKGGIVGPDLTGVGSKYNRAQLIESVLYPSKQIAPGYEQSQIRTKDGNVQSGVIRNETDQEVTLYDSSANKIVVRKADIAGRKTSNVSVMPEGLQAGLTHQQFADLIAYLQSLKEVPKQAK
jgi:putative membrane-bound dehydrogenase-like protein